MEVHYDTMDVDTDYEPTDFAMPLAAREPCHEHSLGDNKSVVDKSPANVFDRERDHKVRPSIIGPGERPGAFKTNGSRQACTWCVHINEDYNTYHEVVAYKYVYGTSVTNLVSGKNNSMMLLNATDDVFHKMPTVDGQNEKRQNGDLTKVEIEKAPSHS